MEFWKDDKIASIPTQEGNVPFNPPGIDKACSPYFRTFGNINGKTPPLVVLHGTGSGPDYIFPFAELWLSHQIPTVFYDQIGCSNSTRLPETKGDEAFWQPSLFIAELKNLLDHLQIHEYYILGHRWGGMWGGVFAAQRPPGLRRLVLASPCASKALYHEGMDLDVKELPLEYQKATFDARKGQDPKPEGYDVADEAFTQKFFLGGVVALKPVMDVFKRMQEDDTVVVSLFGTNPTAGGGSTRTFDSIPDLHKINVPTLAYNSQHDICHDVAVAPYFTHIPRVRWLTFANCTHFVHLQDSATRDKLMRLVGDFLSAED
ncbi:hypothetical protein ANO11243_056860 [Dothideomycetidae sp. 11243]|nr:hypothetical protein ANO11243_056860 [fungal sp. No.11243]